ncbi:Ubiquitin-like protein [Orbilia ellipsospora]|uniref:Ubiquitin-like protein ATG12 n=1 Tax=Orbilia ellipsospora TaxID=2528407 RepID=A0AAV9X562_9PEZI
MSSPPLFPSSADPELQPPSIQLPVAGPSESLGSLRFTRSPPPFLSSSPNEQTGSPTPAPLPEPDSDDEDAAGTPITLSASVMLTNIPRDSRVALANAFLPSTGKVTIRLLSVGSTPSLKKNVFTLTASKKFSVVVNFLRNKLKLNGPATTASPSNSGNLSPGQKNNGQSLFVYVNNTFAPSLDEEVGNLFRCFKREDELLVNYCLTPAFG